MLGFSSVAACSEAKGTSVNAIRPAMIAFIWLIFRVALVLAAAFVL
jgi:hypothetical protein